MSPFLVGICIGVAAVLLGSLLLIVGLVILDRRHDKTWEGERPEWADDATPLYDRLVCEAMEREEGWIS